MRYHAAVLAFAVCSNLAAGSPGELKQHDGAWLLNGIRQYQRLNARESLSDQDANEARVVKSYVCAVVDTEKYLVQRADLLAAALEEGRTRKKYLDSHVLDGMTQALLIIVPLMKTAFFANSPTCDRALLIVQDFLQKYPEGLDEDAGAVVDKALLDAYEKKER